MQLRQVITWVTILFSFTFAFSQSGVTPPPGLLIKVHEAGRLLDGQEARLVWLEDVEVSAVERFTSNSSREHLRFSLHVDGQRFGAIFYAFDWTDEDLRRLQTGRVSLIGLWETFQGEPSFVAKWAEASDGAYLSSGNHSSTQGSANAHSSSRELVRIANAQTYGVEKFVSKSLRMHVRFGFTLDGDPRSFDGVIYEGVWSSSLLDSLRQGTATLVGYWDEFQDSPSFVLERVE